MPIIVKPHKFTKSSLNHFLPTENSYIFSMFYLYTKEVENINSLSLDKDDEIWLKYRD